MSQNEVEHRAKADSSQVGWMCDQYGRGGVRFEIQASVHTKALTESWWFKRNSYSEGELKWASPW